MTSIEFLDAVRVRYNIPSDNKLAQFLGFEGARISMYRTGRRTLDPKACHRIATVLQVTPEYVLAEVQAERAKRPEDRQAWRRLAALAKKAQAAAVGAVAPAGMMLAAYSMELSGVFCILCQLRCADGARRARRILPAVRATERPQAAFSARPLHAYTPGR